VGVNVSDAFGGSIQVTLGSQTVVADLDEGGQATVTVPLADPAGSYEIVAAYGADSASTPFEIIEPVGDPSTLNENTSWPNAAPLTTAGLDAALGAPGEARWFKFPVGPDTTVQVDLSHLDQNFDLALYGDIGQAFTTLTTKQDLLNLSAQFAGDAYAPSVYSPSVYSPSVYSPSIYSPSIYSPSVYSPSVYSPSIYSPSVYSPSLSSPSLYSASVYSPSVYSPSDAFLQAFSSAQTRSLIAVSANEGVAAESVRSETWGNTGYFYVRVQGRNGAFSPSTPFHLGLSISG